MADKQQILETLPRVMRDLGAIGKEKRNQQQRYQFRSVDQVLNRLHPVLVAHGVSLSVQVRDHRVKTTTEQRDSGERIIHRATLLLDVTFHAPDGPTVTTTAAGEGIDYGGDKSTNKAMSAAFKYAMFLGLCVPVDASAVEDSDRDMAEPTRSPTPPARTSPPTPSRRPGRATPDQVEQIEQLARDLGFSTDQIDAALQQRNADSVADLSRDEATAIIADLEGRIRAAAG